MKLIKYFTIFAMLCTSLTFVPTFHVQANSNEATKENMDETKQFLAWYEANKNINYARYTLQSDLYFDSGTQENPILLDGNGKIEINCNGYSMYIQSNVVIDNKEMLITTAIRAKKPILVVENGNMNANLTLKNGYVAGNSIALSVESGNVVCPSGTDLFKLVGANYVMDIKIEDIVLRNLEIAAEGEGDIIAVKAKSNIQIENSSIDVKQMGRSLIEPNLVGIYAQNKISIINSSITVKGQGAKSAVSEAGSRNVQFDETTKLVPSLDIEEKEDDIYTITKVVNADAIYVPQGMDIQQLELPKTVECELKFLDKQKDEVESINLNVQWDLKGFDVSEQGEYVIEGTFDKEQLSNLHIYQENSFQPRMIIKVTKQDWLNTLYLTEIVVDQEHPYVETYFYFPYNAKNVRLQYSEDGTIWEDGYSLREDGKKETNLLTQKEPLRSQIITKVYFSKLAFGGSIRLVVEGGPYEGVWGSILLKGEMIFTPPGEDGGGGNRGGGGQSEGEREKPRDEQEEDTEPVVSDVSVSSNKVEIKHQSDTHTATSKENGIATEYVKQKETSVKKERSIKEGKPYLSLIVGVGSVGVIVSIIFLYKYYKRRR